MTLMLDTDRAEGAVDDVAKGSHKPVQTIRRAKKADFDRFYGPGYVRATTAAWVGLLDDEPVGIAGLAWVKGKVIAFLDMKPAARPLKIAIFKALSTRMLDPIVKERRMIYADPDLTEPNALKFLTRLGFHPVEGLTLWRRERRE